MSIFVSYLLMPMPTKIILLLLSLPLLFLCINWKSLNNYFPCFSLSKVLSYAYTCFCSSFYSSSTYSLIGWLVFSLARIIFLRFIDQRMAKITLISLLTTSALCKERTDPFLFRFEFMLDRPREFASFLSTFGRTEEEIVTVGSWGFRYSWSFYLLQSRSATAEAIGRFQFLHQFRIFDILLRWINAWDRHMSRGTLLILLFLFIALKDPMVILPTQMASISLRWIWHFTFFIRARFHLLV